MNHVNQAAEANKPQDLAVPSAVKHLDSAKANLNLTISLLEDRLSTVLAPVGPKGVDGEAKIARHSLALQIEADACDVDASTARLQVMINRLEL